MLKLTHQIPDNPSHSTTSLQLSPLKNFLACSNIDGKIHFFSSPTFKFSHMSQTLHDGVILKLKWSPPELGQYLVSSGYDGVVNVVRVIGKDAVGEWREKFATPVYGVGWCGERIIVGTAEGEIWEVVRSGGNGWTTRQIAVFNQKSKTAPLTPLLLTCGRTSSSILHHLALSSSNSLLLLQYNTLSHQTTQLSRTKLQSQIIDLTWQEGLFEEELLFVLIENKVMVFDRGNGNGLEKKQEEIMGKGEKCLGMEWSEEGTVLNVYVKTGEGEREVQRWGMGSEGKLMRVERKIEKK